MDEYTISPAGDPFTAAPSFADHDDTVEAHYASLERPHACIDGWVFITYEDEYGEEREASYRCRRCNTRGSGGL